MYVNVAKLENSNIVMSLLFGSSVINGSKWGISESTQEHFNVTHRTQIKPPNQWMTTEATQDSLQWWIGLKSIPPSVVLNEWGSLKRQRGLTIPSTTMYLDHEKHFAKAKRKRTVIPYTMFQVFSQHSCIFTAKMLTCLDIFLKPT